MACALINKYNLSPMIRPAVGCFYQIKDAQGKEMGHLLGTIHQKIHRLSIDFNKKMYLTINKSQTVLMECDIRSKTISKEIMKELVRISLIGTYVFSYLFGAVDKPMELEISERMEFLTKYTSTRYVMDLESIDTQLKYAHALEGDGPKKEITFTDLSLSATKIVRIFERWREGDVEALYRECELNLPARALTLHNERSASMARLISKYFTVDAGCPCFIAIGAGHLGGKEGVIELLKRKGYTCEQIMPDIPKDAPAEYPPIEVPKFHQTLFSVLMTDCNLTLFQSVIVRSYLKNNNNSK